MNAKYKLGETIQFRYYDMKLFSEIFEVFTSINENKNGKFLKASYKVRVCEGDAVGSTILVDESDVLGSVSISARE